MLGGGATRQLSTSMNSATHSTSAANMIRQSASIARRALSRVLAPPKTWKFAEIIRRANSMRKPPAAVAAALLAMLASVGGTWVLFFVSRRNARQRWTGEHRVLDGKVPSAGGP